MTDGSTEALGVDFWATMFDGLADSYDQSGVAYFETIARGLVDRLAPQPGERVLDLGSGRGAATVRLAEAVGPAGSVTAVDASARMVELLGETVRAQGLAQVTTLQGDATAPPEGPYDAVSASLVVFFLPDPVAALSAWRSQLAPGGRLGISTFGPWPDDIRAIMEVVSAYRPDDGMDPTQMPEAFRSDESVEGLFRAAGLDRVRTERATYPVDFRDVDQWLEWALGTAVQGLWMQVPDEKKPEALDRIASELAARDNRLHVEARYTLASLPE
ncbi:class I SAM-dependent methyltransferase [Nocardioides sp. MH1]|uniref:class I SAM-dependent methyltransferase n=1 Tax=Nocardioides sp. MH1 TaxID=3242490 RepID=UPI003521C585